MSDGQKWNKNLQNFKLAHVSNFYYLCETGWAEYIKLVSTSPVNTLVNTRLKEF